MNSSNTALKGEKKGKLHAKDLINVGVFTAIYFILFFATGMIGYVPILLLVVPFICPFITGIVFMLFLTRVKKFGMISIMGVIVSLLMIVTGHPWPVVPISIGCALLSDIIMYSGEYKSWGKIRLGYIVFSEWLTGMLVPIFFMRDTFFKTTREGYGDAYADTLYNITPMWVFFVLIGVIALGALCGAYLGRGLLKKHFQRAGIA